MRANLLMGSPRKPMMLLGWCYSIFRALAVIPGKENGESKGRRERGMKKKKRKRKTKGRKGSKGKVSLGLG